MPQHKFGTESRIRSQADFDRVFRGSDAYAVFTPEVILRARSNGLGHPRLGIKVSRRVSKLAVRRNRIKRMIREQFRIRQMRLPAMDIVAVCRPSKCGRAKVTVTDWSDPIASVWNKFNPPPGLSALHG